MILPIQTKPQSKIGPSLHGLFFVTSKNAEKKFLRWYLNFETDNGEKEWL